MILSKYNNHAQLYIYFHKHLPYCNDGFKNINHTAVIKKKTISVQNIIKPELLVNSKNASGSKDKVNLFIIIIIIIVVVVVVKHEI
ncbi:hypothetical protein KUTeg_024758 [Tegillarca granosa]|uniref:Uncharacterized protein n=1 Tax=Tegillarca granosa TaxID=220873 RepID=A0ABQ9E3R3_TEGGR|nr:hypothetical protein KUTeg_024758 [Tegillarca granosa]